MSDQYSADEMEMLRRFRKLDDIEQVIFLRGVEALGKERITQEQFTDRVTAMFARHRACEDLTIADLESIGVNLPEGGAA